MIVGLRHYIRELKLHEKVTCKYDLLHLALYVGRQGYDRNTSFPHISSSVAA